MMKPDALSAAMGQQGGKMQGPAMEKGMAMADTSPAPEDNVVEISAATIPAPVKEGDEVSFMVASINGDKIQLVYSPKGLESEEVPEGEGQTPPPSIGSVGDAMSQAMQMK